MGFQQRSPRRAPRCPWCDQEMIPDPDSRGGRLCCPNGEAVEYRLSGGRWYFNGRLNGLDEPVPPAPNGPADAEADEADAEPRADAGAVRRSDGGATPATALRTDDGPVDTLDAFRAIASAAWGADAADDEGDMGEREDPDRAR